MGRGAPFLRAYLRFALRVGEGSALRGARPKVRQYGTPHAVLVVGDEDVRRYQVAEEDPRLVPVGHGAKQISVHLRMQTVALADEAHVSHADKSFCEEFCWRESEGVISAAEFSSERCQPYVP